MIRGQNKSRFVAWWLFGGLVVVVAAALARPAASQGDDLDVLKVIPENYKLLFENPFVFQPASPSRRIDICAVSACA